MNEKNNGIDSNQPKQPKEIDANELLKQLKENIRLNPVMTDDLKGQFEEPAAEPEQAITEAAEPVEDIEILNTEPAVTEEKPQKFKVSRKKRANIDTLNIGDGEDPELHEQTVTVANPAFKSFLKQSEPPIDANELMKKHLDEKDYNTLKKLEETAAAKEFAIEKTEPAPAEEIEEAVTEAAAEAVAEASVSDIAKIAEEARASADAPRHAFSFTKASPTATEEPSPRFAKDVEISPEEMATAELDFVSIEEVTEPEAVVEEAPFEFAEEAADDAAEAVAEAAAEADEIEEDIADILAEQNSLDAGTDEIPDLDEVYAEKGEKFSLIGWFKNLVGGKKTDDFAEISDEDYRAAKADFDGSVQTDELTLEEKIKNAEDFVTEMEETRTMPVGEKIDSTDQNIMIAFGMDDELEKTVGVDAVNQLYRELDKQGENISDSGKNIADRHADEEFTSMRQTKEIFEGYRKKYHSVIIKTVIAAVLTIALFFFENLTLLGGQLPEAANPKYYPIVYSMISLQILILCAALIWRELIDGIKSLIDRRPIPESITAVLLAATLIYHIIVCAFPALAYDAKLYNFPVALCILFNLCYSFMSVKREIYSFNVVATKRVKYAVGRVNYGEDELEKEAFSGYLPKSPSIFKVNKANFVDNFFKRSRANVNNKQIISILLPAALLIAAIFGIVAFSVTGEARNAVIFTYLAFVISMPMSVFVTYGYPIYRAAKEAYSLESAIIGEAAIDEYSSASAVSFEDKDVFPSYGVKVKSVKVYGHNRIDHVIYFAGSLFRHVGGPLSDVFEGATRDLGHSSDVELLEVDDSGLEAMIDNVHIHVGTGEYLKRKEFAPVVDADDAEVENDGDTGIMHMVIGDEVAAKFYISYIIDPDFEPILKHLYRSGICVGIRTFDPNIDNHLLSKKIKISKYPVKILKCRGSEDLSQTHERVDSGIVSKSGSKSLLQTLSLCDKVSYMTRTNVVIKIFAMFVSVVLLGFVLALGHTADLASLYVALYQLFWILPMAIIAKLFI